jgi:hypothetical protein
MSSIRIDPKLARFRLFNHWPLSPYALCLFELADN